MITRKVYLDRYHTFPCGPLQPWCELELFEVGDQTVTLITEVTPWEEHTLASLSTLWKDVTQLLLRRNQMPPQQLLYKRGVKVYTVVLGNDEFLLYPADAQEILYYEEIVGIDLV
jgi:hypothetical protein